MTIEVWLAFITSITVLFLIPGPVMVLVISRSITHGKKSVLPLVSGVLSGAFISISLSLIGLGAILAASATLFLVLKTLGAGYLVYLGVRTWRQKPQVIARDGSGASSFKETFGSACLITALNPKDLIFFVAFLPQFINSDSDSLPQILILMVTFLIVDLLSVVFFAVFSHVMRAKMDNIHTQVTINKVSGSALIGAGLITAMMQRI